jgi:hypothetical protein
VKRYTVELRIREAGDVGDALPVSAVIETPGDACVITERKTHATVGGAVYWAMGKVTKWMRNRESKG